MKVTLDDLKRLEALDKSIETMFDEKGFFKITSVKASITFNDVVRVGEELLWMSTLLYKLLHDLTDRYEKSTKRTIKILDRITSKILKK